MFQNGGNNPEFRKLIESLFKCEDKDIKKRGDGIINALAEVKFPKEIAQDIFLKKVFEHGLALQNSEEFSPERFDRMNNILSNYGYRISMRTFKAQYNGSETRPHSEAVRADMLNNCNKQRNKELGLLYLIGEMINRNSNIKIDEYATNKLDSGRTLYANFVDTYYKDSRASEASGYKYKACWDNFINNKDNRQIALQVYKSLHNLYENDAATEKRMVEKLLQGISELKGRSDHHNIERKISGVIEELSDIKASGSILNADELRATTITSHPADNDPHHLAHKFDTEGTYIFMQNGRYRTGPISQIKKGDLVFAPVVEVADKNGNFHPAIPEGTLLVTSQSGCIKQPYVPGISKCKKMFYEMGTNIKTLVNKLTQPSVSSVLSR